MATTTKANTKAKAVEEEKVDPTVELMKQMAEMQKQMAEMAKQLQDKDTKLEKAEKEKSELAKKSKVLDRNRRIPVRSVTEGGLTYISKATGLNTYWSEYGSEHYMEVEELIRMKASSPEHLTSPWVLIEDEEVIDYLGLKSVYENIIPVDELDEFFTKPVEEVKAKLLKAPKGTKELVRSRATKMVMDGTLDSNRVIKAIEEILKIDLSMVE